jgi:OPT oligopeptide transporter protein
MMSNVAIYPTYALNLIVVNEHWYHTRFGFGFNFCLAIATHMTGFGLAGVCKRILVRPASLIWPQTLVTSTLLNTLHAEEDLLGDSGAGITRYRWFVYVAIGAFLWQWMPGERAFRVGWNRVR